MIAIKIGVTAVNRDGRNGLEIEADLTEHESPMTASEALVIGWIKTCVNTVLEDPVLMELIRDKYEKEVKESACKRNTKQLVRRTNR